MIIDVLYLNHNWNFWFFHSHQCKIEGNLINSFLVISTETTIVPPTLICFNYTSALNLRYPNTPISGKFGTGSNCSQNNRIRLSKSSINIHFYNFKERKYIIEIGFMNIALTVLTSCNPTNDRNRRSTRN